MKNFSIISITLVLVTLFSGIQFAGAYVASSSNYRIQEDSINTGGGLSTSTNYRTESTMGEAGSGTSSSATFSLKAGYQQMHETYLAISAPGNIILSPSILTTGGGTANGSALWTVITDNPAGYTMSIRASSTPVLSSGANNFPDYIPAGANPDLTFTTPAASSRFGFSPEGTNISTRFKDNGVSCNTGATDTVDACWDALSTSAQTIANSSSGNHPLGIGTTIKFRAVSGASNTQPAGTYNATTTLTVIAL